MVRIRRNIHTDINDLNYTVKLQQLRDYGYDVIEDVDFEVLYTSDMADKANKADKASKANQANKAGIANKADTAYEANKANKAYISDKQA